MQSEPRGIAYLISDFIQIDKGRKILQLPTTGLNLTPRSEAMPTVGDKCPYTLKAIG